MRLPPRLPVHPPPLPHETLSSWLTRLARANASTLASWLPAVSDYPHKMIASLDFAGDPPFLARLADKAGIVGGAATLHAMTFRGFVNPTQRHCFNRWLLSLRHGATKPPHRFCAVCLAGDHIPHLRRAWRLGWVRWCPLHAVRMDDGCRACGAKLAPWRQPWDRPFLACWKCGRDIARSPRIERRGAPPDGTTPRLIADAVGDALPSVLAAALDEKGADDLLARVWSAQKFADRVGTDVWGTWADALGYDARSVPSAIHADDGEAWSFALGWRLATREENLLVELAARHQAAFNRATTLYCPARFSPLRRPVQTVRHVTEAEVRRVVEGLLERGEAVHFAAVAERLQVPPDRMADSEAFRALVEDAARAARERWRERLREQLAAARDRLKAKGRRLSRANLAATVGITLDLLATYEREAGDTFAVSPREEYPAMVRGAVAAIQARGERVTTTAVSQELGRERSLLEKHPELKRIVREARQPVPTPAEVRRACRDLRAKGQRVSTVAVARVLGVGRHVIERSPFLHSAVEFLRSG